MGTDKGRDWRADVAARSDSTVPVDVARAREPGRGREANTPEQIPPRGWRDILWRVLWSISENRILSTSGSVAFFALLAVFPGIAAIVSLYGLFADASTIGKHLSLLAGLLPGGILQLIAEQITLISRQGNETLGAAFVVGTADRPWERELRHGSALRRSNVVYDEREKRSLVRFYATTLLFTFVAIVFVILAITGVVVVPLILKVVGLASTTEWLLAILRWPVLLTIITFSLACIYRFGPSRRDARWRWVTWGSILGALLWVAASMLFSWYVTTFDSYNQIYGSLGAGVEFMVWLWISAVVVLPRRGI